MAELQGPPPSRRSKIFGIRKNNSDYIEGTERKSDNKRRGYEEKYEEDILGEELGDEARIWRVMLDEGRLRDVAMLDRFRDHLDVNIVFAGLFSAVVTAFVAQTTPSPQDDNANTMNLVLLSALIATQRPSVNMNNLLPNFTTAAGTSPWINRCWYLSLILSLFTALGPLVMKQWLQEYERDVTGPPKRRALIKHHRLVALMRWKIFVFVPVLPLILHASLVLFLIGLMLHVRQFDRAMSNAIIALTVLIYSLYLASSILPVFYTQCPYRSPLSNGALRIKSLITSSYAYMERLSFRSLQSYFNGASWARTLMIRPYTYLPIRIRASLSTSAKKMKHRLQRLLQGFLEGSGLLLDRYCTQTNVRLREIRTALQDSWDRVFKTSDSHEWEAVTSLSESLILDSLDFVAQASSDLSVTPLVVQAASNLPIDPLRYRDDYEEPRYHRLLQNRILPWFINALSTRRTVFDWAPHRENELQRMACSLLLAPLKGPFWKNIDRDQYCICITRVMQALMSGILSASDAAEADVPTLSATLLALGDRLDDLDRESILLQNGALLANIATAYLPLVNRSPRAGLRLHPIIWHHMRRYLGYLGSARRTVLCPPFAIALWRSFPVNTSLLDDDEHPGENAPTSSRLTLGEWLSPTRDLSPRMKIATYRLLCPSSCKEHTYTNDCADPTAAEWLHMACHGIDSYAQEEICAAGNVAFDNDLGFLVQQLFHSLFASHGYSFIDSALAIIGCSTISSCFRSTFLTRPSLSLLNFVRVDAQLHPSLAVSLFWFLMELTAAVQATDHPGKREGVCDVIHALDQHASIYRKELADTLVNDVTSVERLRPAVEAILEDPQLAVLGLSDLLATTLATHVSKSAADGSGGSSQSTTGTTQERADAAPSDWLSKELALCIHLDVLCAARADMTHIDEDLSAAPFKLHSVLLFLRQDHRDTWRSELARTFREEWVPLSLALALNSPHALDTLAELVGDMRWLVQDTHTEVEVRVPDKASEGTDMEWYHLFTSTPNVHTSPDRPDRLPISALVTFEVAVGRMNEAAARPIAHEDGQSGVEVPRGISQEEAVNGAQPEGGREEENQGGGRASTEAIRGRIAPGLEWLRRYMPSFSRADQDGAETSNGEV